MKVLFISPDGDGAGLAVRMAEEGHQVKLWIKGKGMTRVAQGLVQRVDSWRPHAAEWADFVIGDMVGFGSSQGVLDRFDVLHLGFNPFADALELDRPKQRLLFRKLGVQMPESFAYESPGAAEEILSLWEDPGYVIKPSGNLNTGKTYVTREPEIYRWALEQFTGDQELLVQRIVEGVEVSTEGWFNGSEFILPFNHTFEEKRFLEGGLGPNVGCMGNVVIPAVDDSRLVENVKKFEPWLRRIKYKGPFDLNTIVNEAGIHTLEATPRLGYDAIEALAELLEEPVLDLLWGVAMGTLSEIKMKDEVAIAVRLSVPPYPHADPEGQDRRPVLIENRRGGHYWLTDLEKHGTLLTWAGGDGVIAKVTAAGKSVRTAQQLVYQRVDKVKTEGLQYRTDIGIRVEADMKQLREWGVLGGKPTTLRIITEAGHAS